MLLRLTKLDYEAAYAFVPPIKSVLVDSSLIISVEPIETRRIEKCVRIHQLGGVIYDCVGTVEEIMEKLK